MEPMPISDTLNLTDKTVSVSYTKKTNGALGIERREGSNCKVVMCGNYFHNKLKG